MVVVIFLYCHLHHCDFLSQVEKAKEEIVMLQKKCDDYDQEITRLKSDLKKMSGDYGKIATRSRIVSRYVLIPLHCRKSYGQIELIYLEECCLKILCKPINITTMIYFQKKIVCLYSFVKGSIVSTCTKHNQY